MPLNYKTLKQKCMDVASAYTRAEEFHTALNLYSTAIRYLFIISLKDSTVVIHDIYYQIANIYGRMHEKMLALKYVSLAFNAAIRTLPVGYTNIVTYKTNKETTELSLLSDRLRKTELLINGQHQIVNYNATDLITLDRERALLVEPIVIWLKPSCDEIIRSHIGCTQKVFFDSRKCGAYLLSLEKQLIFLVLPGFPEKCFMDTLYNYQPVTFVYVWSNHTVNYMKDRGYKKIRGPFASRVELLNEICSDIKAFYANLIAINVFNVKKDFANDETVSFIQYHAFIKLILMYQAHQQAKTEPINFYNFELNKAILQQNIPKIYEFHSFIANVHSVIDNLHKSTFTDKSEMLTVYYNGNISQDKLDELQQNIGAYVSVNNFISTHTKKHHAAKQAFDRAIDDLYQSFYAPIVIQFNVDPRVSTDFSFAPLSKVLDSNEQGLVFSLGSIFRLDSVRRVYRHYIMYHYITLSWTPVDPMVKNILNKIKLEIDYDLNRQLSFGNFLCFFNEYNGAEEYFNDLLIRLQHSDTDQRVSVYVKLGDISAKNLNLQEALNYYNKAIQIQFSSDNNTMIELSNIHRKIGNVSLKMGKQRKSLNNYLRAIEIQNNHLPQSESALSLSFIDIGIYYTENGKYQIAMYYLKKAAACLPNDTHQRDIYVSLNNFYLGITYSHLKEYHEAIECHGKALQIYLDSEMSYNKQYIKSVYYHMGLNYFLIEKYDNALNYFNIVIENKADTRLIAIACYYMGSIYYHRGNYDQSLKWYLISLENSKDASMTANVAHNVGTIYMSMNLKENSIKFFDEALKSELEFGSKQYPFIIQYCNYMEEVNANCELRTEAILEDHDELDIVTYLFETRNKTSSIYEIIWFDPDNSAYSFTNITRLCSNTQIVEHLKTHKAQTVFIIAYSHLPIQLNNIGKTIHIYMLLLTNEILAQENICGYFNDMDELLIQLTNDLVLLHEYGAYNHRKMDNGLIPKSNWRKKYPNHFHKISVEGVPAKKERKGHQIHPINKKTFTTAV